MERVKANALVMKLSDAEWQWDRKKLTFYFTAEKRVDFRTLVRELASMFRTRIELKQIGVRDEAKRLDGIGRCGRQYCSASWLPELRPVNLGVAKDQRLSLNPSQISGACGRLMCCLRYEHEFYVQSRKRFPKEGQDRSHRARRGEGRRERHLPRARDAARRGRRVAHRSPLAELRAELDAAGDPLPSALDAAAATTPMRSTSADATRRRDIELRMTRRAPIVHADADRVRARRRRAEDRRPPTPERSTPAEPPRIGADRRPARADAPRRATRRAADVDVAAGGAIGPAAAQRDRQTAAPPDDGRRRGELTWRGSTSRPPSTTRTASRTSATRTRRSAPTPSRGIVACAATTCTSSSGMDEHGQKVAQTAAERGVAPQALVDEIAGALRGDVAAAVASRTTSSSAPPTPTHKRGVQRADRAHLTSATPTTSTRRRTRAGTASAASRSSATTRSSTASACCTRRATLEWIEERNWFFRLTRYRGFPARSCFAEHPEFLQPESRRNEMLVAPRPGARGHLDHAARGCRGAIPFPHPAVAPARRRATYVWFDALPNYLTATGFPDAGLRRRAGRRSCTSSARTSRASTRSSGRRCSRRPSCRSPSACGRTASCCSAASGSASRRACGSTSTRRSTASAPTRSATSCCAKCRSTRDGNFSWERFEERYNADLANALGQPREPRDRDGREVLRRRRAGGARDELDRADAADLADVSRGDGRHARLPAARGAQARHGVRGARQRVRAVERSRGRSRRIRTSRARARDGARRRSCASSRGRRCCSRRSCPSKAQELWEQLGAPGTRGRAALRRPPVARRHRLAGEQGRGTLPAREAGGGLAEGLTAGHSICSHFAGSEVSHAPSTPLVRSAQHRRRHACRLRRPSRSAIAADGLSSADSVPSLDSLVLEIENHNWSDIVVFVLHDGRTLGSRRSPPGRSSPSHCGRTRQRPWARCSSPCIPSVARRTTERIALASDREHHSAHRGEQGRPLE